MPIESSTIAEVGTQRDGRRWVLEKHIDHLGIEHVRHWLAEASDDLDAAIAAYALRLLDDLRDAEIQRNVANVMADCDAGDQCLARCLPRRNSHGGNFHR
jgi:hypothetical protein